jgi:acyl-CoA synthetase (AMP-forming)/AMP-acid ligase II
MKRGPAREGPLWRQWLRLSRKNPERIVLIDATRETSFTAAALTRRAGGFREPLAPFHPGERVAFRVPNGPEWMALFLALQRAGLTAIPLDGALPPAGCFELARQVKAHTLYLEGAFHPLGRARRSPRQACVKVTSGSAGLPKTVPCEARHLLADGRQVIATMAIRPRDRNLAAIPLGHSYGLGNLVLPLILQGTAIVTAESYLPRQLAEWIARHRVTVLPLVPALFRVLAALPPGPDLAPVRTAISAGAVLSPAIAQAFFARYGIRIHNFYGSSETGGICYDRTGSAALTGRSVGKPLVGVTLAVERGRVTVQSSAVATRSGRWRLNDGAEWNGRGELVLLGRLGPGANIGGKKVHPREVEQALRSLPAVSDASVWRAHSEGRDLLVAAVETTCTRAAIEQALADRLPAWKWPKAYWIARELPRTPRGKLDQAALRRRLDGNAPAPGPG